jgi:hypothetical protein
MNKIKFIATSYFKKIPVNAMCFRVTLDVRVSGYLRSFKQWNGTNRKVFRMQKTIPPSK